MDTLTRLRGLVDDARLPCKNDPEYPWLLDREECAFTLNTDAGAEFVNALPALLDVVDAAKAWRGVSAVNSEEDVSTEKRLCAALDRLAALDGAGEGEG